MVVVLKSSDDTMVFGPTLTFHNSLNRGLAASQGLNGANIHKMNVCWPLKAKARVSLGT